MVRADEGSQGALQTRSLPAPAPRRPTPPRPRHRAAQRRRLDLIVLGHLWLLAPLAILWFFTPAWRDPGQRVMPGLSAVTLVAFGYLGVRTWFNLNPRLPALTGVWPYTDVLLVSAALAVIRNPTDALTVLYFIPLTSAAATLDIRHMAAVGAAALGGYLTVILLSDMAWTVPLVYRMAIIALMASLYSAIIRTVTGQERAAERAEFQRELAREIHDGIQHLLITLGARLELARRLTGEAPDRAAAIIAEEREAARRAGDELRYLVRRLRVDPTTPTDLATALRLQIAAWAERWPFTLNLHLPPQLPRIPPAAEHGLLRIIQEGLTNVAKHARASEAEVRLSVTDHALQCTITDNGVGFDPALTTGSGLDGLRERVAAVGGHLQIHSRPGGGTVVYATIPLQEAR